MKDGFFKLKGNAEGVSLVELLVAMVILLFVSLALMQTALLSIEFNTKNVLRDEAVRVAEMRINELRNTAFDDLTTGQNNITGYNPVVLHTVRKFEVKYQGVDGFHVDTTITDVGGDTKGALVEIFWTWKGEDYSHSIETIIVEEE
jgi:type IV pilus assembly protein PilV